MEDDDQLNDPQNALELEPITFIVSTERVDRDSERMLLDGLIPDDFHKNPVGYYNHFRSMPSWWTGSRETEKVTPIVRWTNLRVETIEIDGVETRALLADAIFDPHDKFSVKIYHKVKGKFINAASIGFIPVEWSYDEELMLEGQTGATFTKWKLIEISITDMPSNVDASAQREEEGEGEEGENNSDDEGGKSQGQRGHNKKGKPQPFAIRIKSFVGQQFIKTNSKKTTKMAKKTKSLWEKVKAFFKSKGIDLKKTDGTDVKEEDFAGFEEEFATQISEEKIGEIVDQKLKEFETGFKSSVETMITESSKSILSKEQIEETVKNSIKSAGLTTKADHDKLVGEVADIKSMKSGGDKGGNGNSDITTDTTTTDEEILAKNPQYKQLLRLRDSGQISKNLFKKQAKDLLDFIKSK